MPSLFNPSDNQKIIDRINTLTPDSKALWGKMSVSQMVAHCQKPAEVSVGELKLKRGLMGFLFGRIAKKQLLRDEPFKKSLPTVPQFVIKNPAELQKEKDRLIALVQRFSKEGPSVLTKDAHPFFGKLTTEEWDQLQWKHLDHHLQQFGA